MKTMKCAGVVVTYNRKDELIKNIESADRQTHKLDCCYIIDNCSTDKTYEFLIEKKILPNERIKFIRLQENIGGAGGFYTGMKCAYDDGCDCVIMMDDDGRPADDKTFSALLSQAKLLYKENPMLMLNSLVICDDKKEKLSFGIGTMSRASEAFASAQNGIIKNYINPFNGTLITRELIAKIGFPNKDFFIRGDEVDYQSRARKEGALIATIVDSIYYHPSSELFPLLWRGKIVYVGICPPWKGYYLVRNYVYRIKRDEGVIAAIKQFIFQVYSTKKCNPDANKCMRLLFKGFLDGMMGKLGMRVRPGQK